MSTRFTPQGLVHEHSDDCSHSSTAEVPDPGHCVCVWAVDVYFQPTVCPTHGTQSCQSLSNRVECDVHYVRSVIFDRRTDRPV